MKRCLWIFSTRIFDSKVEGGKPRLGRRTDAEGAGSAAPVATNSPIDGLWGQLEADASGNGIERDEKYDNE